MRLFLSDIWAQLMEPRGWRWRTFALVLVTTWIFAAGPSFTHTTLHGGWQYYEWKYQHPFEDMGRVADPEFHAAKLNFRLTLPIIANVLGFGRDGTILFNALLGCLAAWLVPQVMLQATRDRRSALLLSLAVAASYPTCLYFRPVTAAFDALAFALVLIAFWTRRSLVVYAVVLAAVFTDERAIMAAAFVPFFHYLSRSREERREGLWGLLREPSVAAIVAAALSYVVLRLLASHVFGLKTYVEGIGTFYFLTTGHLAWRWFLSCVMALQALYVLVIVALYRQLAARRDIWVVGSLVVLLAAGLIASGSVYDMTRSAAYLGGIVFVAAAILRDSLAEGRAHRWLLGLALAMLLVPKYELFANKERDWNIWIKPMPVEVWEDWRFNYLNKDTLNHIRGWFGATRAGDATGPVKH